MAPKKKNEMLKPTELWSDIFKAKGDQISTSEEGKVYKVEPVDPYTFVSSPEYLGMNTYDPCLSEEQYNFLQAMSDFENGKTLGVLWVGKGGGKNTMSCVLFSYIVYKLLCMYNPHDYFQRSASKAITLINVAINADQGKRNFFDPLKEMIKNAGHKAFKDFGFNPEKDINNREIMFPKNIQLISANSAAGGIEGYDVLCALLDEVDDSEFHSIDKLLTTLRSSSKSRFFGKEKVMAISYSRYEGSNGKIKQLYEDFIEAAYAYVRKIPSWVFNPNPKYTRESLNDEFKENEIKARTIYECEPGDGFLDSWIKDTKRIKNVMDKSGEWILDVPLPSEKFRKEPWTEYKWHDSNGVEQTLNPYRLPVARRGIKGMKYVFAGDPGLGSEANGGDGYGVTLAHREIRLHENGKSYPHVVVDFAFRFTGAMFPQGQVQMAAIEDLINQLITEHGYDIKVISFDGWNSATTAQNIARTYKTISVMNQNLVTSADYTLLRDLIFGEEPPSDGSGRAENNGGITLPYHPILFHELKNLKEDRSYKIPKVDHDGDNSSKDISDTVAKCCTILVKQWNYSDIVMATADTKRQESVYKEALSKAGKVTPEFVERLLKMRQEKELEQLRKQRQEVIHNAYGLGKLIKGK